MISEYWTGKFKQQKIGTLGFDKVLKDYLLWGFGLGQVCKYIVFENEKLVYMCIAFMLNDELYNYSKKLAKELPDEE